MNNESQKPPLWPYEWPGTYFMGEEEMESVGKVLRSRSPYRYFGHDVQGYANRVEDLFRERLGRKNAVLVSSGTTALSTAMMTADIGPGDEVLIPGYFWMSCPSAVIRAGAIPRLVDINDTFTMDPDDLEQKINERTKAVLLVHMNGACGEVDRIVDICKRHNVTLIEDVAQANGGRYQGQFLGSFGDIATFSFQVNKNITTGEGGVVVSDDEMLGKRSWAFHHLGYSRNAEGKFDPNSDVQSWGQGVHMSEVSASIAFEQVKKLDQITSAMRARNHKLYDGLSEINGVTPRRRPDPQGDSGPFVLFTLPSAEIAKELVARTRAEGVRPGPSGASNIRVADWGLHLHWEITSLVNKNSVHSSGRPWTDPLNEFHTEISYEKGVLPVMEDLTERSIIMTVPPILTDETINQVLDIYHTCAKEIGLS